MRGHVHPRHSAEAPSKPVEFDGFRADGGIVRFPPGGNNTHLTQTHRIRCVWAPSKNPERIPDEFMFQPTKTEFDNLRSQTVISKSWGSRALPSMGFRSESEPFREGVAEVEGR